MSSLVQLYGGFDELLFRIEENGGELTPELETQLQVFEEQIPKKIDNVGFVIAMKEQEIIGLKNFKKSIDAKIKSGENAIDSLKKFLSGVVRKHGTNHKSGFKQLKGSVVTFNDITKVKRVITDDKLLQDEYRKMKVSLGYAEYKKYFADLYPELESEFKIELTMPLEEFEKVHKEAPELLNNAVGTPDMDKIAVAEICPRGCEDKTIYNVAVYGLKKLEVPNE
jgi:hypothetical protein